MYAIIEACGRQYKVQKGDEIFFEKIDSKEGEKVSFDKVVFLSDDKKIQVGSPYVAGAKVEGKVVSHGKHKKITVFKYKAKKNERKTQGHRQEYTKIQITSISGKSATETVKKEETAVETKKVAKTEKAEKTIKTEKKQTTEKK